MDGRKPVFGNIGGLLEKFKNFTPSDLHLKKVSARILTEVLGVEILKADLSVTKGTLFVKCSPLVKQEIKLKQEMLLTLINDEIPNKKLTQIR
jgi:multisubunit Na+/H+ antiporter MnhE subunit